MLTCTCTTVTVLFDYLQFFVNEMTYPQGGQDGKPKRGYQASPEDTYYNLAQYYDIPTISFRCVTGPIIVLCLLLGRGVGAEQQLLGRVCTLNHSIYSSRSCLPIVGDCHLCSELFCRCAWF